MTLCETDVKITESEAFEILKMANQISGSSSCNGRSSSLVNGKVVMNYLELLVAFGSLKDSLV